MASTKSASGGLLKLIFLAHLVLSSWGMSSPYFLPHSYIFYNLLYLISLLWAVNDKGNADAIIMAFLINSCIIILDAFALAFSWPRSRSYSERLYFGLAIRNEVLRPIAAILLYRVFKERDTENQGIRGVFEELQVVRGLADNRGTRIFLWQGKDKGKVEAKGMANLALIKEQLLGPKMYKKVKLTTKTFFQECRVKFSK